MGVGMHICLGAGMPRRSGTGYALLPKCSAASLRICLNAQLLTCSAAYMHNCPGGRLPICVAAWIHVCLNS